jgi:predicted Rossmann-fold nucleotide-binding protein
VLVNTAVGGVGFYDDLLRFLDHVVAEGFILPENRGLVQVARDPAEALALVERTWRKKAEVPAHDPRLDAVVK